MSINPKTKSFFCFKNRFFFKTHVFLKLAIRKYSIYSATLVNFSNYLKEYLKFEKQSPKSTETKLKIPLYIAVYICS